MKKIMSLLLAFAIFFCVCSCSKKPPQKETTIEGTTTVTTTKKPVETTTTTETTYPGRVDGYYGREIVDNYSPYEAFCIQSEEAATLISEDFTISTLSEEESSSVLLPAGTVVIPEKWDFSWHETAEDPTFILFDGRRISFEKDKDADEQMTLNGKRLENFFVGYQSSLYPPHTEPTLKKEGEVLPMTPLDSTYYYQNLTVNVDWNGDGKIDTFRRECPDPQKTWEQTITYTDGATGKETDITELTAVDGTDDNVGFSDNLFLYQDESGNIALLDTYDWDGSATVTAVYTYDADKIISYTESAYYQYFDGQIYLESSAMIFGNAAESTFCPALFDGKELKSVETNVDVYFYSVAFAEQNGEELPGYYTCPIQEIAVEKLDSDMFIESTIYPGFAIFPQYYRIDDTGNGYLYFCTIDGSKYRATILIEPYGDVYFGDTNQNELFWCHSGG